MKRTNEIEMVVDKPRECSKEFTLIEILVTIAIISIIAAILFPVFARTREPDSYGCNSNVGTTNNIATTVANIMGWGSAMNDAALVNPSGTIFIGERQNGDWPAYPSNNIDYYAATSNEYKDAVSTVHF